MNEVLDAAESHRLKVQLHGWFDYRGYPYQECRMFDEGEEEVTDSLVYKQTT